MVISEWLEIETYVSREITCGTLDQQTRQAALQELGGLAYVEAYFWVRALDARIVDLRSSCQPSQLVSCLHHTSTSGHSSASRNRRGGTITYLANIRRTKAAMFSRNQERASQSAALLYHDCSYLYHSYNLLLKPDNRRLNSLSRLSN